jgi:hypothetical protein
MAKKQLKTTENDASVEKFLNKVEPEQKRDDCRAIVKMMEQVSGEAAKMWGTGIVGCGSYHYVYDSGHSGDMCLIGFAPRKANIALYLMSVVSNNLPELKKLGKIKTSKGCIYVNKLEDLNGDVLKTLMKKSIALTKAKYK